jgi:hypothetical protein
LVGVFKIQALNDLAECSLVDDTYYLVSVGDLLTNLCKVLTIFI